jgi:hypothetical protein
VLLSGEKRRWQEGWDWRPGGRGRQTMKAQFAGFIFDQKGLIDNLTLKGS